MSGVVVDPRHDVRAAKALRVLERRIGDELAGFEIDQPDDDRGRPEIDREAMDRTGRSGRSSSPLIPSTMRSPSRTTAGSSAVVWWRGRKMQRASLDAHLAPPHRVALDLSVVGRDPTLAREAEAAAGTSRCLSHSVGGDSSSSPSVTSTTHSLHLPCVTHDVGTRTPARSAALKSDMPAGASMRCPLTVSVTGM